MLSEWLERLWHAARAFVEALVVCVVIALVVLLQTLTAVLKTLAQAYPVVLMLALLAGAFLWFDALRAILTASDAERGGGLALVLALLFVMQAFARVLQTRRWNVFAALTLMVWLLVAVTRNAPVLLGAQTLFYVTALAPVIGICMVGILLIQKHERTI